ncbi:hypothetical protein [Alicyclobacillus sp. SO9]|uniref:hypothetical protein n=1 Tax=Alicyclobacillus sp. SO9 TaxID=2665646 RepID=UPI0018E81A06|nr:hypothetical protein [Alicyclobacillus sp. SO9]QQE79079.1 hypothetical protein GI364_00710 [Alicyclobacillus sp. SO9]
MKKVELLQDLLELAFSLNAKSDKITEFFGADEIEFLDDEEKMLLDTVLRVGDVKDEGHRLHLEDRFYDYLFGNLELEVLIEEILGVHSDVSPDYREMVVFGEEDDDPEDPESML